MEALAQCVKSKKNVFSKNAAVWFLSIPKAIILLNNI